MKSQRPQTPKSFSLEEAFGTLNPLTFTSFYIVVQYFLKQSDARNHGRSSSQLHIQHIKSSLKPRSCYQTGARALAWNLRPVHLMQRAPPALLMPAQVRSGTYPMRSSISWPGPWKGVVAHEAEGED